MVVRCISMRLWGCFCFVAIAATVHAELVDIGTYKVDARCEGSGPSVLLSSGLGNTLDGWNSVFSLLSPKFRTCSYDRAGVGASESSAVNANVPRSCSEIAVEMESFIDAVGLASPITIVGEGLGGLCSELFVARNPSLVSGIVLADGLPAPWRSEVCMEFMTGQQMLDGDRRALDTLQRLLPQSAFSNAFAVVWMLNANENSVLPVVEGSSQANASFHDGYSELAETTYLFPGTAMEYFGLAASGQQVEQQPMLSTTKRFVLASNIPGQYNPPPAAWTESQKERACLGKDSAFVIVEGNGGGTGTGLDAAETPAVGLSIGTGGGEPLKTAHPVALLEAINALLGGEVDGDGSCCGACCCACNAARRWSNDSLPFPSSDSCTFPLQATVEDVELEGEGWIDKFNGAATVQPWLVASRAAYAFAVLSMLLMLA
mmetsp:Transcript_1110/g.2377  ORF Transcript_1110/g.2377 Transcript_1110/m.2377 type:complete len:432 (-) Transcript_1110:1231-2526(-)